MQYWVDGLSDDPLTAAAKFHADVLPTLATLFEPPEDGSDVQLALIFSPADHTHRAWRLAAVQSLARRYAPARVNAISSDDDTAIEAALHYLETAFGLTGQYLPLDGTGASKSLC